MPEQQASPSCSQLPSTLEISQPTSKQDGLSSTLAQEAKRTYLGLLPASQLIGLLLAIDAKRDTPIFPQDLDEAIKALQEPDEPAAVAVPTASPAVKAEPTTATIPPSALPPQVTDASTKSTSQPPSVQPPQYKPPPHKMVYPYTHTPYYPIQPPTQPLSTGGSSSPVPPPSGPVRHPLFTSTPLSRDPSKPLVRPTPPPAPVSSRDDPNAMPSYEEMLVEAIMDVSDQDGTAPKVLFSWMAAHYPLQQNFRPSASQALHKALKRGRLLKMGGKYRLNPAWGGGPTTSKRATRRPTANRGLSPPQSHTSPKPPTALPHPYHTPYGYYVPHPMPHAYAGYAPNAALWVPGQPIHSTAPQSQQQQTAKTEDDDIKDEVDMEEDEAESEEEEESKDHAHVRTKTIASLDLDEKVKRDITSSLLRVARILKRFAKKGEGTQEENGELTTSRSMEMSEDA